MPVLALRPAGTYDVVPTRTYPATLDNVVEEQKEADMYHDQPYIQLCFHWLLGDVPGNTEPVSFRSWATLVATLNPKSTLFGILSALDLVQGGALIEPDTDNWLGRSCTIYVEKKTRADGSFTNSAKAYSPTEPVAAPSPTFPRQAAAAPAQRVAPPVRRPSAPVAVDDDLDLTDNTPF